MSRLTKKQRMKLKREREADHKAFMRRGEVRRAQDAARDARAAAQPRPESPRERHQRELREREAERIAVRRAEHNLADGVRWAMADASVGRTNELCAKLRRAEIPHFRATDEVERIQASGRVQKLKVPLVARTVFVGVENREHLAKLQALFPWLMERVPGQRYLRESEEKEAPWHVDRYERTGSQDAEGRPVRVPALIPEKQLRGFAETLIGSAPILDMAQPFEIGETVRVADGPFASFHGAVEAIDYGRSQLKVAVSVFGRATPVELEFGQVERL